MKLLLKLVTLGLLSRLLRAVGFVFPVKPRKWVVGGDRGLLPEGNSLHLFDYVLAQRPDIRIVWITRAKICVAAVRARGGEAHLNFSLVGLFHVLTAEVYLFSIDPSDVALVNPKRTLVVNLWHGMPMKKILHDAMESSLRTVARPTIWQRFAQGVAWSDVSFHIATADYYREILQSAFRSPSVEITGQPRDDFLVGADRLQRSLEIKRHMGWEGRLVITYLPTHRKYGKGQRPSTLFHDREAEVRERLGAKVLIVTKNHSLMGASDVRKPPSDAIIVELDRGAIETQALLLATDVLVTDYSSVFVDFLLTNRPIIFYWVDDYATGDNELYFNDEALLPGKVVTAENDLLEVLAMAQRDSRYTQEMRMRLINRYHTHVDGKSSARVIAKIDEYLRIRSGLGGSRSTR